MIPDDQSPGIDRDSDGHPVVSPIIRDRRTDRELWRTADCAQWCGVSIRTWSSAVSHGRAPASVGHLDARTPLWDADTVRAWHAARPSSTAHPATKGQDRG